MMKTIREFLEKQINEQLIQAVLSGRRTGEGPSKVKLRPVELKGKICYQASMTEGPKVYHKNYSREEIIDYLEKSMEEFRQLQTTGRSQDGSILISKKGKATIKTKHHEAVQNIKIAPHNRVKQYILKEGTAAPFLVDLGVMTKDGKIVASRYDKFRQINRFLEFIRDILPKLPKDREITILDFGCGKSYLTFAMYYYLRELEGFDVNIIGLDAQLALDVAAHLLGPGLGAEDAGLELDLIPQAALVDALGQESGVRGGAAEDGGAEVTHELDLSVRVAGGHGQGQAADLVGAAVQARAAGEEAVAIGNLNDVVRAAARGGDAARHQLRPHVHIVLRIAGDDGAAGGAAGALDAHDVVQRRGEQAVGELVAQVGLLHEGQVFEIVHIADVLGADALGVHARAVDGNVVVFVFHRPAQALGLEGVKLIAADGFHFRVKHIVLSGCGQAQHPLR